MGQYTVVLRSEFQAEDDSFLLKLRVDLEWDRDAFSRLIQAMQGCCEQYERSETMESWMAEGFWYMSTWVRDWSSHPDFPRPYGEEYYQKAFRRLDDLAYWFFTRESLYEPGHIYEPL